MHTFTAYPSTEIQDSFQENLHRWDLKLIWLWLHWFVPTHKETVVKVRSSELNYSKLTILVNVSIATHISKKNVNRDLQDDNFHRLALIFYQEKKLNYLYYATFSGHGMKIFWSTSNLKSLQSVSEVTATSNITYFTLKKKKKAAKM